MHDQDDTHGNGQNNLNVIPIAIIYFSMIAVAENPLPVLDVGLFL